MTAPLLALRGIDVHYGDLQALFELDLHVDEGETVAIVGANGAGKSTLLQTVAGLIRPTRGAVEFDGVSLASRPPHERVAAGIALVPEGRRLFASLTVEENLLAGAYRRRPGPWTLDSIYRLFPLVAARRHRRARDLSGGEQQAVAIGRALMSNPRLLLLDEVSLGLAPIVVKQLYAELPAICARGTTAVIVEQDVAQALAAADRVYCLLEGRAVLAGPVAGISLDDIAHAYLGVEAARR